MDWSEDAAPGTPYWWEEAAPRVAEDPLPGAVDLLVIGAGYAGLSAAIAAHDAGARVAVVDAGDPGAGASTRNGGMFGAHPRLSWPELARLFGEAAADALFAEAAPALEWAKDLIAREGSPATCKRPGGCNWRGHHRMPPRRGGWRRWCRGRARCARRRCRARCWGRRSARRVITADFCSRSIAGCIRANTTPG
jgi:choline dehydrogenase-like flavoprotein